MDSLEAEAGYISIEVQERLRLPLQHCTEDSGLRSRIISLLNPLSASTVALSKHEFAANYRIVKDDNFDKYFRRDAPLERVLFDTVHCRYVTRVIQPLGIPQD